MNSLRRFLYKPQISVRLFNAPTSKNFTTPTYLKSYNSNNFQSIKVKNYYSNLLKELALKNTSIKAFSTKSPMAHTRIEEELHETAHIDYDRVDIQWNPSVAQL